MLRDPIPVPMLRFRTLGGLDIEGGSGNAPAAVLAQPRRTALLLYLALAPGYVRRDELAALFWRDSDAAHARGSLSQALHFLRRQLGDDVICTRGAEEVGIDRSVLATDAVEMIALLEAGENAAGLALYRGELAPAFHLSDAPEIEQWLDGARAELRGRAARAAARLRDSAAAQGNLDHAVRWGRQALELAAYDEAALCALLTTLDRAGDRGAAVAAYDTFATRLATDLDVAPSPETQAVLARIRERSTGRTSDPAVNPGIIAANELTDWRPARGSRRLTILAALGGAGALALLAALATSSAAPRVAAGDRIAVLPFAVAGDSALGYLREGMADLVSTRLEGLGAAQAIDPSALFGWLRSSPGAPDPTLGRRAAERFSATAFVLGRVVEVGNRVDARAALYDQRGSLITSASASGGRGEVDRIAAQLTRALVAGGMTSPGNRLARIAVLGSESEPALRAYLEGERALRATQYAAAADDFRRAVAADSMLALGWFRLGTALEWIAAGGPERRAALERARLLSDRLSEREQLLLRGFYAYSYGSLAEAEDLFRRLVRQYPEDLDAWYGLAEVEFHGGAFRGRPAIESERAFREIISLDHDNLDARLHLTRILALKHDSAGLDSLLATTLPLLTEGDDQAIRLRLLRAYAFGTRALQDSLLGTLASVADLDLGTIAASLATMTGNYDGAARVAALLLAPSRTPRARLTGRIQRTFDALASGSWSRAQTELSALALLDPETAIQLGGATAALPFAVMPPAERDSIEALVRAFNPVQPPSELWRSAFGTIEPVRRAQRLWLLSVIATRRGDALAAGRWADSLHSAADSIAREWGLEQTARATALLSRGRPADALAMLETIRRTGSLSSFPRTVLYTHAFERSVRATAYEQLGRREEAAAWRRTYRSYLSLADLPFERGSRE